MTTIAGKDNIKITSKIKQKEQVRFNIVNKNSADNLIKNSIFDDIKKDI